MEKSELLELFTREQRIVANFPGVQTEVDGRIIRKISLEGEDGFIAYSHLTEETAEAAIETQIARFARLGQDFEWKVYDYDPPSNLLERLRRRGFEIEEPEALLVLDLTAQPAALERPVPPSVRRVTEPGEVDAIVDMKRVVWGTDHYDLGNFLKRELEAHPELLSVYVARQGEMVVSAAWVVFHPGTHFASLWGGSTHPQFRRQGHYTGLLAARAREAWSRGFTLLSVDASPMSRPILEKHGFQYLATSWPCQWKHKKSRA